jgi:hypothetical protein
MNTVLYFSPDDVIYETRAYSKADIAELVHNCGLESLSSADAQFDFWFTTSTHRCHRGVNRSATRMLLATTQFNSKSVPLLRGGVVVATHDPDGVLGGLSWQQLDVLAQRHRSLTRREQRNLGRRIGRDDRRRQRSQGPAQTAGGVQVQQPTAPQ